MPVGIFVGGTSGIGQGIAEAFARHTKGNAHIVLVGRNRAAAEAIIARFPKPSVPGITHEFVECDSKLVKNVKKTAAELLIRFPRINFLVLSAGAVSTKPYDESEEGIDRRLAVLYYSREDAKVTSILKAGSGGPIDPDNLGLKKNFSFGTFKNEIPAYHDTMIQSFAEQEPEMTFLHSYPGTVIMGLWNATDSAIIKSFAWLYQVWLYPFSITLETCGECQLYRLLKSGPGADRIDATGESIGKQRYYAVEKAKQTLWEHTVDATAV
ncbi:NAD(P)-binding protein [Mycena rebaudengoi]|nr:NAD(P)-binding protein [Mycena rebaudengoi]